MSSDTAAVAATIPLKSRRKAADDFEPARFQTRWVECRNARNLDVTMKLLERSSGEGRFVGLQSPAGFGKTRTAQWWAGNSSNNAIYLHMLTTWRKSPHGFLQALCRKLGMIKPPWGSDACMTALIDYLMRGQRPVFLDEFDLVPQQLDLVRVLAEITATPFVLIGENLADCMTRNRRVWSRTFHWIDFQPVDTGEIVNYVAITAGLEVTSEAAAIIRAESSGALRNVKRIAIELVEIANSQRTRMVSESIARQAARTVLKRQGRAGNQTAETNHGGA